MISIEIRILLNVYIPVTYVSNFVAIAVLLAPQSLGCVLS
jgi:hypothetical protein